MPTFTLKYPGECRVCGRRIEAGEHVKWHHALGHTCLDCDKKEREEEMGERSEQSK